MTNASAYRAFRASTSSSTESTIDSTRSTSPPKSGMPFGVSTMLIPVSSSATVFFDYDGDAAPFLVVGVHDTPDLAEPRTERSRLFEQLIDEGGLAMVDVRDDRDVSKILDHHGEVPLEERREIIPTAATAIWRTRLRRIPLPQTPSSTAASACPRSAASLPLPAPPRGPPRRRCHQPA